LQTCNSFGRKFTQPAQEWIAGGSFFRPSS
jgi:hypothetical protein